jgi:DNA-binding response OmpR family regulator
MHNRPLSGVWPASLDARDDARNRMEPASTSGPGGRGGQAPRPPVPTQEPLRYANIELRLDEYQVLVDGRRLALTMREFEVLSMLVQRPDRVVQRQHIYAEIWGKSMKYRERAIDVFVRKIRTKLASAAPDWVYIHTHFGIGYRFSPERRHHGSQPPEEEAPTSRR